MAELELVFVIILSATWGWSYYEGWGRLAKTFSVTVANSGGFETLDRAKKMRVHTRTYKMFIPAHFQK